MTPTSTPVDVSVGHRLVSSFRRRANNLRRDEAQVAGWILIVALAFLVLVPTVLLFLSAIRVQFSDAATLGVKTGSFTGHYLWEIFISSESRLEFWVPFEHTIITAAGACVVAVVVGGGLAWCVARFEFPFKRLLVPLLMLPYLLPAWAVAQSWLTTFHTVSFGGSPGFMEGLGIEPPRWLAAGAFPIVVVIGIHLSAFVYLLASGGLRNIGGELEEAATILGGRRGQILRRITGPLLIPALTASAILVFAHVLGDFATVYLLGLPVHYDTLATSLYSNLQLGNNGMVAVIAITVVILGGAAIAIEGRLTKVSIRYAMLRQGSVLSPQTTQRPWSKYLISAFVGLVVLIGAGLPVFVLAISTVSIVPGRLGLHNFSLQYWIGSDLPQFKDFPHGLLHGIAVYSAAWSSVRIMGIAAILCGLLGLLVGYVVNRSKNRFVSLGVRQLSFLPYLVPGISLAAAYIILFDVRRGPIPALYGSLTLVIIAMVVLHLPFSSKSSIASFAQMGKAPEEAARIQGASFPKTIGRIVIPMQMRPLVTGITLAFVSGLKELNVVIMLTVSSAGLLATMFFNLNGEGYTQLANGVAFIIVLMSLGGYLLLKKLSHIDLVSPLGGNHAEDKP